MPLRDIEQLLKNEIGLNSSTVGSDTVRHAVEVRMRACEIQGIEDYLSIIRYSRTELDQLIDTVVIPETWFYRDHNPFAAFSNWLRESWSDTFASAPLRILSVPCSTGEEAYTLAMCLADYGVGSRQAHIDAIDISSVNLATAEKAEYGINSFRSNDLSFRDRHFEAVGQRFRLRDDIRSRVHFARANILDSAFHNGREPYHVIFCRNLLIYFDRETQHRVIDILSGMLAKNGLLFLGHAETSLLKERPFEPMDFPRSFGFIHREQLAREEPTTDIRKPRRSRPEPRQSPKPRSELPFAEFRPDALPANSAAEPDTKPIERAFRLADEGHLDEAAIQCEALLKEDSCQADPYYLLGVIREATGNSRDAEQMFRKALYLAPGHYEALTHLSVICERNGDVESAQRFRDRAARTQADVQLRRSGQ